MSSRIPAFAGVLCAFALTTAADGADHAQMLRQLIQDATQGRIAYQMLDPGLAEAVRPQAANAQAELTALGPLQSVTLASTGNGGMEIYRTVFERGVLEWAFHVNDKGLIDNAIYRPAKPAPLP